MPHGEHAKLPCRFNCGRLIRKCPTMTCHVCLRAKGTETAAQPVDQQVVHDQERKRREADLSVLRAKYGQALKRIEVLEQEHKSLDEVASGIRTFKIEPQVKGQGTTEATVVMPATDWHVEERVDRKMVNGLNEYNLEIAKARSIRFFQTGLRLTRLLQQDVKIENMVLPLLGDFISNDIHDEFPENNLLKPIDAILYAQELLVSGIEFLLNNSKLKFVLPCHSGNHARTTLKTRFSSENGHSLEYFMYRSMEDRFRGEKRLQFVIPDGPHSHVDVMGKLFRFHHGHMIKYLGGTGGLFIPAFKAIKGWNEGRPAQLIPHYDVFGHYHQDKDGGIFMSSGPLIGFNMFALSNKFAFEPPSQKLILVDSKRGRTCQWPIYV